MTDPRDIYAVNHSSPSPTFTSNPELSSTSEVSTMISPPPDSQRLIVLESAAPTHDATAVPIPCIDENPPVYSLSQFQPISPLELARIRYRKRFVMYFVTSQD